MGIGRIYAIAQNTFREAVRDRVLYVLLFFAAVTILGSKALGWVSVGQDIKIMKDITLASVLIFGVLTSVFIGTDLVYKEIDKRTLYTILARPVRRYEFILGKYFGLSFLLALTTVAMTVVATLYVLVMGGTLNFTYYLAVFLIFCELLLVNALAVLMSTVTAPVLGALIVVALFIFGNATGILVDLPQNVSDTAAGPILSSLYYLIPNLSNFNIRAEAANDVSISFMYVVWTAAYGAVYSALFLYIAALAFEEKDV